MTIFYILAGVTILALVVMGIYEVIAGNNESGEDEKSKTIYQYSTKNFFLTRAEHECYNALVTAVGNDYFIFAQVHLPKGSRTKLEGGLSAHQREIGLCDKTYISPKLAIELDDKTHERPERKERDVEVERVLIQAGLRLLRLENQGYFNPTEFAQKIKGALS